MWRQCRRHRVEQRLRRYSVRWAHGCGRNHNHPGERSVRRQVHRECASHGVACEDGAVWQDQSADEKLAKKCFAALFGASWKKRAVSAPMSGEDRGINAQITLSKTASYIGHELFVCGKAMKSHYGGQRLRIGFLEDGCFHPAACGIKYCSSLAIGIGQRQPRTRNTQRNGSDGANCGAGD